MNESSLSQSKETTIVVETGICGFNCIVRAKKADKRSVQVSVIGSECKMVEELSNTLGKISISDLFSQVTKNPVFLCAERAGCHPTCIIPFAILKAIEVEMGMALPKKAGIDFKK